MLKMNGTIPPVPLYAFMVIGTALLFLNTEAVSPNFKHIIIPFSAKN
jgi:hypothetical protein